MKPIRFSVAAASLVLASVSTGAFSQTATGGVEIGGDVKINATAEQVTTTAEDGVAVSAIGSVRGDAKVDGNVEITATVDTVTTSASSTACAETSIGTVGSKSC